MHIDNHRLRINGVISSIEQLKQRITHPTEILLVSQIDSIRDIFHFTRFYSLLNNYRLEDSLRSLLNTNGFFPGTTFNDIHPYIPVPTAEQDLIYFRDHFGEIKHLLQICLRNPEYHYYASDAMSLLTDMESACFHALTMLGNKPSHFRFCHFSGEESKMFVKELGMTALYLLLYSRLNGIDYSNTFL